MQFLLAMDTSDRRLVRLSVDEVVPDDECVKVGGLVRIDSDDPTDPPYKVLMLIEDEKVNRFLEGIHALLDSENLSQTLDEYTRLCGLARSSVYWPS